MYVAHAEVPGEALQVLVDWLGSAGMDWLASVGVCGPGTHPLLLFALCRFSLALKLLPSGSPGMSILPFGG